MFFPGICSTFECHHHHFPSIIPNTSLTHFVPTAIWQPSGNSKDFFLTTWRNYFAYEGFSCLFFVLYTAFIDLCVCLCYHYFSFLYGAFFFSWTATPTVLFCYHKVLYLACPFIQPQTLSAVSSNHFLRIYYCSPVLPAALPVALTLQVNSSLKLFLALDSFSFQTFLLGMCKLLTLYIDITLLTLYIYVECFHWVYLCMCQDVVVLSPLTVMNQLHLNADQCKEFMDYLFSLCVPPKFTVSWLHTWKGYEGMQHLDVRVNG